MTSMGLAEESTELRNVNENFPQTVCPQEFSPTFNALTTFHMILKTDEMSKAPGDDK